MSDVIHHLRDVDASLENNSSISFYAVRDVLRDAIDEIERLSAEGALLRQAIEDDIADAKAACGGDGNGCETYRNYYDSAARRWQKCAGCPMDALHNIRMALYSASAQQEVEFVKPTPEIKERVKKRIEVSNAKNAGISDYVQSERRESGE